MAISKLSDLNYGSTLGRFKASLKFLEKNWNNKDIITDQYYKDEMLFHASKAGNRDVVKFLIEGYNANPNIRRAVQIYSYPLSNCIYYCNITKGGGNFRDTAIYLMDHGADPSVNNNEPLKAAYESYVTLIAGSERNEYQRKITEHDPIVLRILEDPQVIKTIFKQKQEKFYFLVPIVSDLFIF